MLHNLRTTQSLFPTALSRVNTQYEWLIPQYNSLPQKDVRVTFTSQSKPRTMFKQKDKHVKWNTSMVEIFCPPPFLATLSTPQFKSHSIVKRHYCGRNRCKKTLTSQSQKYVFSCPDSSCWWFDQNRCAHGKLWLRVRYWNFCLRKLKSEREEPF